MNYLQMAKLNNQSLLYQHVKTSIVLTKKDDTVMMSSFEAAKHLICKLDRDKLQLKQKNDLFFLDYDFIPLLI